MFYLNISESFNQFISKFNHDKTTSKSFDTVIFLIFLIILKTYII